MKQFIYILHFDRPLCHAKHYSGATSNLIRRMERHAAGQGATLTAAVLAEGIGWQLGGLYEVTTGNLYEIELRLKSHKRGSKFCQICNPQGTARLLGTRPVDRSLYTCPVPETDRDDGI